jgi:aspartyl-tRNA synthetase
MREFCNNNDFIEIHSPKIINSPSESGAEVFEINYFNKKAYLAQSPQFYKQMAIASGFERVYEVGTIFRAERSFTSKHATEFSGFDVEFSGVNEIDEVIKFEENLIQYAIKKTVEKYGKEIKKIFNIDLIIPTTPFPKMKLDEVINELSNKYNYKNSDMLDLDSEGEKLCKKLTHDKFNHQFLFITDYPKDKRAFYHLRKNDIPQGYDLI